MESWEKTDKADKAEVSWWNGDESKDWDGNIGKIGEKDVKRIVEEERIFLKWNVIKRN